MGKLPIETVYAFEPVPAGATAEEEKLILGSEASLWTELVLEDKVTSKMFPRLFAFAEVLWTPRRSRDIRELQTRIGPQLRRFDLLGVPYYGKPQTSGTTSSELPQSPAM